LPVNEIQTLAIDIGAATDIGNVRELNEDAVLAEKTLSTAGIAAVLLAADGVGGHQAGEVASGIAADAVRRIYVRGDRSVLPSSSADSVQDLLASTAAYVNQAIYAYNQSEGAGNSATTFTLCAITDTGFEIAHVGDSRAYLIHGRGITQITDDDSFVADAVRRGQMTEDEARNSPFRNQITKSVGNTPDVTPSFYSGSWAPEDLLLICTDGLTEYVSSTDIVEVVRSGEPMAAVCRRLATMAREAGGHDNISVAAAFNGPAPPSKPTAEVAVPANLAPKAAATGRDPNRLLRLILLTLIGLAAATIGIAVGRTAFHVHGSQQPIIAPIGSPPPQPTPEPAQNRPKKHRQPRIHIPKKVLRTIRSTVLPSDLVDDTPVTRHRHSHPVSNPPHARTATPATTSTEPTVPVVDERSTEPPTKHMDTGGHIPVLIGAKGGSVPTPKAAPISTQPGQDVGDKAKPPVKARSKTN